jgi:hypothetical protein
LTAREARTLEFMLPPNMGETGKVSVGGGQPLPGWPGVHYAETPSRF